MDIDHLASLARIRVSKQEVDALQKDLEKIVVYIDELRQVDVSSISEATHASDIKNVFRSDDVSNSLPSGQILIDQAPASHKGFIKVKSVFNAQ